MNRFQTLLWISTCAATRWWRQQQRALGGVGTSGGSPADRAWRSQTLQLAFWHAVFRVLAPLPPGALLPDDIPPLLDAALEAILSNQRPAPYWEQWAGRPLAGGDTSISGGGSGGGGRVRSPPIPLTVYWSRTNQVHMNMFTWPTNNSNVFLEVL